MQKLAVIMFAVIMLCGCDTKKEERNLLGLELDRKINSASEVEQRVRNIEADQININAQVGALNDALLKDESAVKENKESLANYALSHKLAVAAVAVTVVGIAGVLDVNLDDQQRGAVVGAGTIGALYCMFSDDDCSDATANVSYYGTQIAYYKRDAASQSDKISTLQQMLADLESTKAPLLAERTSLSTDIENYKSQIKDITCHGLLCI